MVFHPWWISATFFGGFPQPPVRLDVVPLQPGGDVVRIPTALAVEEGRQLVPAEPLAACGFHGGMG